MNNDLYSAPQDSELEILFEDDAGDSYEFDKFVVWHKLDSYDGSLYWGSDSGCSCPLPFEDVYGLEDLNRGTANEVVSAYRRWLDERRDYHGDTQPLRSALERPEADLDHRGPR